MFDASSEKCMASLKRIYERFQCEYHLTSLQPGITPTIPSLTPHGFHQWVILLIQAFPNQEYERLSQLAGNVQLYACPPKGGGRPERLPTLIFRDQYPEKEFPLALNFVLDGLKDWRRTMGLRDSIRGSCTGLPVPRITGNNLADSISPTEPQSPSWANGSDQMLSPASSSTRRRQSYHEGDGDRSNKYNPSRRSSVSSRPQDYQSSRRYLDTDSERDCHTSSRRDRKKPSNSTSTVTGTSPPNSFKRHEKPEVRHHRKSSSHHSPTRRPSFSNSLSELLKPSFSSTTTTTSSSLGRSSSHRSSRDKDYKKHHSSQSRITSSDREKEYHRKEKSSREKSYHKKEKESSRSNKRSSREKDDEREPRSPIADGKPIERVRSNTSRRRSLPVVVNKSEDHLRRNR